MVFGILVSKPVAAERSPAIAKLIANMDAQYAKVTSYAATLIRQERSGDALAPAESIEFSFEKPQKMHLLWNDGPRRGQEISLANGKIRGHRGGLLSFFDFSIDLSDPRVLKESRRPLTDIGIGAIIDLLRKNISLGLERKEVAVKIGNEVWNEKHCIRIDAVFEKGQPDYDCMKFTAYVDPDLKLPIALLIYDQPDVLSEQYDFKDLKLNVQIPRGRFIL